MITMAKLKAVKSLHKKKQWENTNVKTLITESLKLNWNFQSDMKGGRGGSNQTTFLSLQLN